MVTVLSAWARLRPQGVTGFRPLPVSEPGVNGPRVWAPYRVRSSPRAWGGAFPSPGPDSPAHSTPDLGECLGGSGPPNPSQKQLYQEHFSVGQEWPYRTLTSWHVGPLGFGQEGAQPIIKLMALLSGV